MLDLEPDGAVAFAVVAVDVQGRADQAGAQQFALPAGQGLAQRLFAQRQRRGARRQAQGLTVQGARGPAGGGEQAVAAADDFECRRLTAGGGRPGAARRSLDIDHDGQQGAGDAHQSADGAAGRRGGRVVMGAGGGDALGRGGASALEGGEAAVGQGQDAQGRGQARDGGGDRLGRRLGQLGQGVVQGQQVEQQLQTHFRGAGGVTAVDGHGGFQRAGQAFQGGAANAGPGLAGQGAAGDGGGGQALGPAHQAAGRAQQLAGLPRQNVGQAQALGLGRHPGQTPPGAGQLIGAARQNVGVPREGRPAIEQVVPSEGQRQSLTQAAIAVGHHLGHPGEGVQFDGEGAAGGGAVPQVGGALGVEAEPGQGEAARQQGARGLFAQGAEVAGADGEPVGAGALQRHGVAGQAVELDPQLARGQLPGDGGPERRVGLGTARRAHRGADRGALQAGDMAFGQAAFCFARGEGAEGAHAAAAFRAWMLAA
ncbi:hypothetical protein D3C86_1300760 [compost metagenome]